jgi:hypothetical protein
MHCGEQACSMSASSRRAHIFDERPIPQRRSGCISATWSMPIRPPVFARWTHDLLPVGLTRTYGPWAMDAGAEAFYLHRGEIAGHGQPTVSPRWGHRRNRWVNYVARSSP